MAAAAAGSQYSSLIPQVEGAQPVQSSYSAEYSHFAAVPMPSTVESFDVAELLHAAVAAVAARVPIVPFALPVDDYSNGTN